MGIRWIRTSHWLMVGGVVTGLAFSSQAQQSASIPYLEGQLPVAPDAVGTLGADLFGDQVNLFNGALQFEQTDITLPGNNTLSVALARRYEPGRMLFVRGQFGDWDLAIPRISGAFSTPGWVTSSYGSDRCSGYSAPPAFSVSSSSGASVGFAASDYWQGTMLDVPGQGLQELLLRSPGYAGKPADGNFYPIVTRNNWQIRCLSIIKNAPGQGFIAVSPDGVQYRFDWMATRYLGGVTKAGADAARNEHFLYASEVTDRFGNWVRYTYDTVNPLQLTRIESNDGRLITVKYTNGRVSSASDGTRTFIYEYSPQADLTTITLPDGSRWKFDLTNMLHPNWAQFGEGAKCDSPGVFTQESLVGTMVHPSGAVGKFTTSFRSHGRTYVDKYCWYVQGTSGQTTGAVYPILTRSQTLTAKSITGPGLVAQNWTYAYASSSGWSPCAGCPDRKYVTVTSPNGAVTRYTFGIRWRVNEGQLLRVDEAWDGTSALRTTEYRYRQPDNQNYPERFGTSPQVQSDWLAAGNRPQDRKIVTQQGTTFTWQVDTSAAGFDAWARPMVVIRFSSLGNTRSENTQYHDNTAIWVLGQVARVTESSTNLETESHSFDPSTAMETARFAFGRKVESYEYNKDGTRSAVINAGNRATLLADYKRGSPQSVTFADQTSESQVINNLGRPASKTNAAGTKTTYGYDAMGRLSSVNYPADDLVTYHPTEVTFENVEYDEYGIAAGHWRQTIGTGNARTIRYFDALWRERLRLVHDSANSDGTSSFIESRYDHEGRNTFMGYATRTFATVDSATLGTSSSYDALGRLTSRTADSELGSLTTTSVVFDS